MSVVMGKRFPSEAAVLDGYEKITSLKSFPYIVPRPGARVEGVVVAGVDRPTLERVDRYEGEGALYTRTKVTVQLAAGTREAFTYVAGAETLAAAPADVEVSDRVADFVKERVGEEIAATVPAGSRLRELEVRARAELLGDAVEELVRDHFEHPGLPPFVVKHRLAASGLPSLGWLGHDAPAGRYAREYLRLIIKAIIFNQVEDRVSRDFRGTVRVTDQYYEHAVSALAALQFVADNLGPIEELATSLGVGEHDAALEYMDYAVAALFIADELYRRERLAPYLEHIGERRAAGGVPLGCELEFSPLGRGVLAAAPGEDGRFDSFYYFDDFALGGRLWKLGGHVDNHRFLMPYRGRVRGFLEFALGRYKILGDLSKPVTADPVILSDLANALVAFAEIKPHSLHLSFQLEEERPVGKPPRPEHLICLLILGGDLNVDEEGVLREKRLYQREVYNKYTGLDFSRYNEHRVRPDDVAPARVIEYQFPRLFFEHSYVDLVMALKGFQLAHNPPPLDLSAEAPHRGHNKGVARRLLSWAKAPYALGERDINGFLAVVEEGLAYETRHLGGHTPAFVKKWLSRVEGKLKNYNAYIRGEEETWPAP